MTTWKERLLIGLLKLANQLFFLWQPFYLKLYFLFKFKKEKKSIVLLSKIITPEMHVVDIGANVGFFSEVFTSMASRGIVYAIEPNPLLIPALNALAQKKPVVKVINVALGNYDKTTTINFYPSTLLNIDGRVYANKFSSKTSIKVNAMSFNQCFHNKKIDFIKMDIQGFEIEVLRGMDEFLTQNNFLYLEFWPAGIEELGNKPEDLLGILERYHYKVRLLRGGHPLITSKNWKQYFSETDYFSDSNILCYKTENESKVESALMSEV